MPGNIIEIELQNFMTFNHLKCKPGSRLNLVIGPNGSGKSSLVCAIALGLGGEPQLLGRATSVGAYVKRGEESGHINISLRGDTKDEQINITRKIDTRNKSEWLFNGKAVPKKDILQVIQRFNIQVNNLTQFLPQDRVCEFAKLTPVQLLEETEKAVGDPQLPIQHRALIEKSRELKNIQLSVERNGETLNQWRALNAELEKDVERVRQREELLTKVESMKNKLPWLKYDMKKAEYMEAKEQEKDAKKKKQKQEKAVLDAKCKKAGRLINENSKRLTEIMSNESHLGVQVRGKYKEMEDMRRQEESNRQRIIKAKEGLAAAEAELENLPPYEPPKDELENLKAQILELEVSANNKRNQKSEKERLLGQKKMSLRNCLDRLKDMENTHNKCLQALVKSGTERIFEAYHWVQEHRNEFNKEVYGPVLLEVNVSDRVHANYLEGHVPYYIWKSFITQDPRDRDFLVKNLKSFDVPVLNYTGDEGRAPLPFQLTKEMHSIGIYSRLDQVFNAPYAVKEVLTNQFGLDRSYIGSKETDQKADEALQLDILDCWTPENHYRWSKSRYGNHFSASVDAVGRSSLLLCSLDVGEIEVMRSKKMELEESVCVIEESLGSFKNDLRYLEEEAAKFHKQREDIIKILQHEKKKRREIESLIDQRRRKLESLDKEDDLDTLMAKLLDQAAKYNIQRFHCAMEVKELLVEAVSFKQSFAEVHMASIEFDAKIRDLEVDLKQHEKFAMQASLHFEYCKKEVENFRQQLSAAKRQAESIATITPELEKEFLEMPTTIEELEAAIQDNISQANSMLFLNNNILEEYEHRKNQIEDLAKKLEADNKELRRCLAEIDNLKENWLPTLRNLVARINETFSRQLQVLSAHHQSGGERSVSTILYLVSLQDLTNCPFRVVDEINQGMDPINERKMFQQLVRAASQLNTPQCFLLTPKLLPDLEYSEACSILNIMNGPWIDQPSKVWSSGDCWGSVTGLVGKTQC
ncbi:structural maintenance of chromosomes protein 5 [Quercus suber]|uniref:Structural maintenance of chromosomes protein 5 n=1 Tax=Quercus suber TaxID=58331 RepID=A0AAW0KA96_QUESU